MLVRNAGRSLCLDSLVTGLASEHVGRQAQSSSEPITASEALATIQRVRGSASAPIDAKRELLAPGGSGQVCVCVLFRSDLPLVESSRRPITKATSGACCLTRCHVVLCVVISFPLLQSTDCSCPPDRGGCLVLRLLMLSTMNCPEWQRELDSRRHASLQQPSRPPGGHGPLNSNLSARGYVITECGGKSTLVNGDISR